MSSPALSLDRLEIRHTVGSVLVSPKEKEALMQALHAVNPRI